MIDGTTTEMTNIAGLTLRIGQTVTHWDRWTGTVIGFNESRGLVYVQPDDMAALPRIDCYPLNPKSAANSGKAEFCRPRDHGLSMGNYREACPYLEDQEI